MEISHKQPDPLWLDDQNPLVFEVTQRCNHKCLFCYNVWKNDNINYPRGELGTDQTKQLLNKIIKETKCKRLTFTGGEPLLRPDLLELIALCRAQGVKITMFTNGALITEKTAQDYIKQGISLFKVPLLSADKKTHNYLSQNDSFDKVTEAMANIKLYGGQVVAVFVGTKQNIDGLAATIELAVALDVDGIMFNRFNVGGEGCKHIEELLPTPLQISQALKVMEKAIEDYEISISCSIPVQPCVVDTSPFKKIKFGYCAAASKHPHYVIDPLGNLRMCDQAPSILGNCLEKSFSVLSQAFNEDPAREVVPESCRDCRLVDTCQGGCKAAAEACYGSFAEEEPFLKHHKNTSFRPS